MAVLFVDMVDSTRLVLGATADEVLELLQAFMEIVVDVGVHHCGDVHDFEGDGALLYFEGVGEAVPAAFRLRDGLLERRRSLPALPLPRIERARQSSPDFARAFAPLEHSSTGAESLPTRLWVAPPPAR
jgi:class 3 adenylate cyclase